MFFLVNNLFSLIVLGIPQKVYLSLTVFLIEESVASTIVEATVVDVIRL